MILHELTLDNFRQYKGENKIKFASSIKGKNTTIIIGNNGAGKSNLFAALNWVLYDNGGDQFQNIVNKEALKNAGKGDRITAKVRLKFSHEGEQFIATREVSVLKNGRSLEDCVADEPSLSFYSIAPGGAAEPIPNPTKKMNSILPSNAKEYFFFDGEQVLERFTKAGHEREVANAVRDVLQYEVLERSIKHLDLLARDYQKDLKGRATGEERKLRETEIVLREERDKKSGEQVKIRKELSEARKLIEDISSALRNKKHAKEIMAERDRHDARRQELLATKADLEERIRADTSISFYIFAKSAVSASRELIDKKREKGEIPAGIREQFLHDLLHRKKCICGSALESGSSEEKLVRNLLNRSVLGSIENALISVYGNLTGILIKAEEVETRLRDNILKRSECIKTLASVMDALEETKAKLKQEEIEDVGVLEKNLERYESRREDLNTEAIRNQARIEQIDKDLDDNKRQLKLEEQKGAHTDFLAKKYEVAREAADCSKRVLETFANEMRAKIEAKAQEIFSQLIWKEAQFTSVKISPNYELEVYDRWGTPARRELSAGERQFFSLAFILAMAEVTDVEAPFVIDTPLGRIDDEPRKRLAQSLPGLVPQLVLLMTNNEAKVEPILKPRLGAKYVLDFKAGATKVKEA